MHRWVVYKNQYSEEVIAARRLPVLKTYHWECRDAKGNQWKMCDELFRFFYGTNERIQHERGDTET